MLSIFQLKFGKRNIEINKLVQSNKKHRCLRNRLYLLKINKIYFEKK